MVTPDAHDCQARPYSSLYCIELLLTLIIPSS
jgi:hypothetical protein